MFHSHRFSLARGFKFANARSGTLMDIEHASRWQRSMANHGLFVVAAALLFHFGDVSGSELSPAQAKQIGKKIWQNECNGTVAGLTSWNAGENFASLGIGHFIWYPKGVRGPFNESFPKFVESAGSRSAKLPAVAMAKDGCPWNSRADFNAAAQSAPMKELRAFLART